ncbi:hypothetical protein [Halalkalibacter wakoensis]|nr:hypothetical protein [Halalkalibacter wakoensis]
MENKPNHYDGSVQNMEAVDQVGNEPLILTDEMRATISGNPFANEDQK